MTLYSQTRGQYGYLGAVKEIPARAQVSEISDAVMQMMNLFGYCNQSITVHAMAVQGAT